MLLYIVKYMYWLHTAPKFISYFPGEAGFFVIGRYMTPVPPILKKVIFFRFLKKNHFFQNKNCIFFLVIQKSIYWSAKQKKSKLFWWILLGFLPKSVKGRQKAKKIRWKRNSFHVHFLSDFSKSCIFPIEEIYQK